MSAAVAYVPNRYSRVEAVVSIYRKDTWKSLILHTYYLDKVFVEKETYDFERLSTRCCRAKESLIISLYKLVVPSILLM